MVDPSSEELRRLLGLLLREVRENAGIEQQQLARLAGKTKSLLCEIESGIRSCSPEVFDAYFILPVSNSKQIDLVLAYAATKPFDRYLAMAWRRISHHAQVCDMEAGIERTRYGHVLDDYTYVITEGRRVREIIVIRTVRSLCTDFDSIKVRHQYIGDKRAGVVTIDPLTGCGLSNVTYSPQGVAEASLLMPKTFEVGDEHRFSYRVGITSDQEMVPLIGSIPKLPQPHLAYRCRFAPDAVPRRIWRMDGITNVEAPGEWSAERALVADSLGCVETEFFDIDPGLCYGIAWDWNMVI